MKMFFIALLYVFVYASLIKVSGKEPGASIPEEEGAVVPKPSSAGKGRNAKKRTVTFKLPEESESPAPEEKKPSDAVDDSFSSAKPKSQENDDDSSDIELLEELTDEPRPLVDLISRLSSPPMKDESFPSSKCEGRRFLKPRRGRDRNYEVKVLRLDEKFFEQTLTLLVFIALIFLTAYVLRSYWPLDQKTGSNDKVVAVPSSRLSNIEQLILTCIGREHLEAVKNSGYLYFQVCKDRKGKAMEKIITELEPEVEMILEEIQTLLSEEESAPSAENGDVDLALIVRQLEYFGVLPRKVLHKNRGFVADLVELGPLPALRMLLTEGNLFQYFCIFLYCYIFLCFFTFALTIGYSVIKGIMRLTGSGNAPVPKPAEPTT